MTQKAVDRTILALGLAAAIVAVIASWDLGALMATLLIGFALRGLADDWPGSE